MTRAVRRFAKLNTKHAAFFLRIDKKKKKKKKKSQSSNICNYKNGNLLCYDLFVNLFFRSFDMYDLDLKDVNYMYNKSVKQNKLLQS